jgi:hypothetical protein
MKISRRAMMGALGIGTVASAPFVPLLRGRADEGAFPKRLILVFTPNSVQYDNFWPTGGETDFVFPAESVLAPLQPFREHLIVPMGLRRERDKGAGDQHSVSTAGLFTASATLPGNRDAFGGGYATAPSFDRLVADALPRETPRALYGFRVYGTGEQPGPNGMTEVFYRGRDAPAEYSLDPFQAFGELFGDASSGDAALRARKLAERRSVLDAVRGDLADLGRRVDRDDRAKLDQFLESLRALERQIGDAINACAAPTMPARPTGDLSDWVRRTENFPTVGKLQMDLLVSALACDRTRVATLQWARGRASQRYPWIGVDVDTHQLSHDRARIAMTGRINRWYSEQFAYLLGRLRSIREGSGTLLDNTVVVWAYEMNNGENHGLTPTPCVVAGRGGGALKTGRFLRFDGRTHWFWNMLVSVAHVLGLKSMQRIGPDYGTDGPLAGF